MLRERRGITHAELTMAMDPLASEVHLHCVRVAQMDFLRPGQLCRAREGAAVLARMLERRNRTASVQ